MIINGGKVVILQFVLTTLCLGGSVTNKKHTAFSENHVKFIGGLLKLTLKSNLPSS